MARFDPSLNCHFLSGYKFFTSATTSEMAVTLAKTKKGQPLSAFFIQTREKPEQGEKIGKLNGIQIQKLKNKLGTKAVPTAELELTDAKAIMVGKEAEGVREFL